MSGSCAATSLASLMAMPSEPVDSGSCSRIFFPDWLRQIANALPFRAMFMTPIEVWLGKGNLALLLGHQVLWIAVLAAAGYAALGQAVRKVVIQGG